jgi:hypothetical protein
MLRHAAVPISLLDVLGRLQKKTREYGFALAGGTSLALRFGHRVSVDLDFFTEHEFDPQAWVEDFGADSVNLTGMASGTLQFVMDGVKVELLRHAYPRLADHEEIAGLRLWSLQDVCAMKLNAIANRGSKKDFHDIAALLQRLSLEAMLDFYRAKYQPAGLMMVVRSLVWFEDADSEPNPVSLSGPDWQGVKEIVSNAVRKLE